MNWKSPPADPSMIHVNNSMELATNYSCNWACCACEVWSQFPGISFVRKATMTLAQINHFIGEMKAKNAYIGRIRVLGGEPTIHPKFHEIIELLHKELVSAGHIGQLEIITNGSHPDKIKPIRHLVKVRVSGEDQKQKSHVANMAATPNSLGYEGHMCNAPWHCGFSLNYYGYFPCSTGAGLARLHDWMHHQRLELPIRGVRTEWPNLQELCNFCYHGLHDEDKVRCGTKLYQLNVPSEETWQSLGPWLNGKQPNWEVYGK